MKMSEVKVGRAYAYNPLGVMLLAGNTERVVVVQAKVTYKVSSWRGVHSHKGFRIRLPDGSTTNVEPRRLLSTWPEYLKARRERNARHKAEALRKKAHAALCARFQAALRKISKVNVVVDTGWTSGGFEIHMSNRDEETLSDEENAVAAVKVVESVESIQRDLARRGLA